jgi:crotonobetainyl-CoA:carnitine CoA-transferase CaiB-like acyl-CoA transferase
MSGPLHGIRVVDMTRALAGPYATLMLADAGADVLKIERPGVGDDTRGWGPPFLRPSDGGEPQSTYYLSVNRNKRSVALDLKDPEDLRRLHRLVAEADVLAENFRPGVMDRLELGKADLERLNERLVVLSITGFGEGGPQGHRPGFDQIVQGEAGLMSFTGPDGGPPIKVGTPISDILAGMFGAYGVAAALVERERTGKGQRVTTSLLASSVAVHTFQGTRWLLGDHVPTPEGNRHPSIAPYGAYDVGDGMIIVAVGSEGLWRKFAPLVDVDPEDPRFATNGDRVDNRDDLDAAMAPAFMAATVDAWIDRLDATGIPAGRVRPLDEVYANPQIEHLGMIDEVDHPTLGLLRLPGNPLRFGRSTRDDPRPPPLLDEHSDDWLD